MCANEVWRDAWVEIDKGGLLQNFGEIRRAVGPGVKICAVLKANAYGLGGAQIARLLSGAGADAFAAAVLSEALEIRAAVPDKEILVLGYLSEGGYDLAIENGISLTMYREEALLALNERAGRLGRKARVQIKVNSGMNRIGFLPTERAADQAARCMGLPNLEVTGIYTHFADADRRDKANVWMQMGRFNAFLEMLRRRGAAIPMVHVASSATVCDLPELDCDMVRTGLSMAGYYTSGEVSRERVHLKPCVKLKARLGNVMPVKAGEGVGYGFTHRLSEDTLVGLLPIGVSDGFTRMFSNNFFVTIRGIRCPVIGTVCMDQCTIDLKNVPAPRVGEEIVVYGEGMDSADGARNVEEVAQLRGTIVDEVLTNLAARLPRRLV